MVCEKSKTKTKNQNEEKKCRSTFIAIIFFCHFDYSLCLSLSYSLCATVISQSRDSQNDCQVTKKNNNKIFILAKHILSD